VLRPGRILGVKDYVLGGEEKKHFLVELPRGCRRIKWTNFRKGLSKIGLSGVGKDPDREIPAGLLYRILALFPT